MKYKCSYCEKEIDPNDYFPNVFWKEKELRYCCKECWDELHPPIKEHKNNYQAALDTLSSITCMNYTNDGDYCVGGLVGDEFSKEIETLQELIDNQADYMSYQDLKNEYDEEIAKLNKALDKDFLFYEKNYHDHLIEIHNLKQRLIENEEIHHECLRDMAKSIELHERALDRACELLSKLCPYEYIKTKCEGYWNGEIIAPYTIYKDTEKMKEWLLNEN